MRERIIYLLVIATLLLLLMRTCKGGSNGRTDYRDSVRTVIRIDTIKGESDTKYVPKPYKVTYHDTTEITYNNTDTQYIQVQKQISEYSDTLRFDSNGYAVVKDSVLGSLLSRSFTYDIFKTTVTNNVILNRHNKAFIGFETTYPIQLFSINFAVQFKKSDNLINLGAGFANSKIFYKAGMLLKIKL